MTCKTTAELSSRIVATLHAMKEAIIQEEYNNFFELYGDIYSELDRELACGAERDDKEYINEIYDLIFYTLIPDSVDLMKETWVN